MSDSRFCEVYGGAGVLDVTRDGRIIARRPETDSRSDCYTNISRFDMDEYARHYGGIEFDERIDVLDIGYWTADGEYVPAEAWWRKEVQEYLLEQAKESARLRGIG